MLRLMCLFHTSIHFQIWDGIISLGMKNYFVLSPSLLSLPALSLSFKHTLAWSQAHTATPSPQRAGWLISLGLWALDFGVREGEKEKMKERGEAAVHWQLRGSRPHWRSLIPPLMSPFLAACMSVLSHKASRAQGSLHVFRLGGTVSIWSLFTPQFQVLETNHKQCAWCSHLWREIEI